MIRLMLWHQLFAAGLGIFTVVMVSKPRLPAMIRHFALASLCLAGLTVTASLLRGDVHGLYAAGGAVLIKVILIPAILMTTARRTRASMQLRFIIRPAGSYFVLLFALLAAFALTRAFSGIPFIALALVVTGFMLMAIRRDLYSQIIGFLTMENGIAAFAVLAIGGIPLIIEAGILLTVTAGSIVMATVSKHVQDTYATGDTDLLTELTE